jgi:hypothetical protein
LDKQQRGKGLDFSGAEQIVMKSKPPLIEEFNVQR